MGINEENLIDLLRKAEISMPAKITVIKEKGEDGQTRVEIEGSILSICSLSKTLFSSVAEIIYEKDKDLFYVWAASIAKVLVEITKATSEKEGDDESD